DGVPDAVETLECLLDGTLREALGLDVVAVVEPAVLALDDLDVTRAAALVVFAAVAVARVPAVPVACLRTVGNTRDGAAVAVLAHRRRFDERAVADAVESGAASCGG